MIEVRPALLADFKTEFENTSESDKKVLIRAWLHTNPMTFHKGEEVIAIADICQADKDYWVWMLISKNFRANAKSALKKMFATFRMYNGERLLSYIRTDHGVACNFARKMGFTRVEGSTLLHEGRTYELYERRA